MRLILINIVINQAIPPPPTVAFILATNKRLVVDWLSPPEPSCTAGLSRPRDRCL